MCKQRECMYACICISVWQDERRTPCSVRSYAYSLVHLHGKALESGCTWSGEYMCRQSMLSSGYLTLLTKVIQENKIYTCVCMCVGVCVYVCVCVCSVCFCIYKCACVYNCISVHLCVYVSVRCNTSLTCLWQCLHF